GCLCTLFSFSILRRSMVRTMEFVGIVSRGNGEAGSEYGIPTANILIDHAEEGVFIGYTEIKDRSLPALLCIRPNVVPPEFAHEHPSYKNQILETHIIDFSEDIYG